MRNPYPSLWKIFLSLAILWFRKFLLITYWNHWTRFWLLELLRALLPPNFYLSFREERDFSDRLNWDTKWDSFRGFQASGFPLAEFSIHLCGPAETDMNFLTLWWQRKEARFLLGLLLTYNPRSHWILALSVAGDGIVTLTAMCTGVGGLSLVWGVKMLFNRDSDS